MHRFPSFLALALLAGVSSNALAQNFDTVTVKSVPLATGVYEITGSGGNIGLFVGKDAVFVIDDQFAPLSPKILAAIKAITPQPVKFVVNTHWHPDHTGGNENLANTGAIIIAHENVRKRLSTAQFIEALNSRTTAQPPAALPLVTFTETVTFHINDDSVVVTHMPPGHTDGDAIIFFTKANVIHAGDDFNNTSPPFADLSSGGSINGFITAADRILAMSNAQTKIIPGHGPMADRARVQAYRDMIIALKAKMATELKAKKTLEQVLADSITKPYAKEWPASHERFVRLLYQEMTRK